MNRKFFIRLVLGLKLYLLSAVCFAAVTVEDKHGTFHIDYVPSRIVVLEFSFADALAAVGVSPVGVADDKDPNRLLPEIRQRFTDWVSVGTRSQPSLEVIASLKPDLIIADVGRHAAVYDDLSKIAPTLLLSSRRETYEENLQSAALIGKVVGKDKEMQQRLSKHHHRMMSYKQELSAFAGKTVQFGVARKNGFFAHPNDSYTGGVMHQLGFGFPPDILGHHASRQIGIEQLLALNPDYLVIGDYTADSIVRTWQQQPLWQLLKAAKAHHVSHVDGNLWSRCRGILAAEYIAKDLLHIVKGS